MKNKLTVALLSLTLFLAVSVPPAVGDVTATDIGPYGCDDVRELHATQDGAILFLSCSQITEAKASYYSLDRGGRWNPLRGGDFRGSGMELALSSAAVYGKASGTSLTKVYKASFEQLKAGTVSFATAFDWYAVDRIFAANGFIYVLGLETASSAGRQIGVYQQETDNRVGTINVVEPWLTTPNDLVVSETHIFMLVEPQNAGSSDYYYASYDKNTHTVGTWARLATVSGLSGAGVVGRLFVDSSTGHVYVSNAGAVYVSRDDLQSFSPVAGVTSFFKGAASGASVALSDLISPNGGSMFAPLTRYDGPVDLSDTPWLRPSHASVPLFVSGAPSEFFISTSGGIASVADIFGTSVWSDRNTGLLSLPMSDFSISDNGQILAGTWAGVLLKGAGGDWTMVDEISSAGGRTFYYKVAFDSNTPDTVYAVLKAGVFKGSVAGSPASITWSKLHDSPGTHSSASQVEVFNGALLVAYDAGSAQAADQELGLHFYNTASGQLERTALTGEAVSAFVTIAPNTIIASTLNAARSAGLGVYRSDDGGATFDSINDAVLPRGTPIVSLSYDSNANVLFAGAQMVVQDGTIRNPQLYRLSAANRSGSSFVAISSGNFYPAGGTPPHELNSIVRCGLNGELYVSGTSNGGEDCIVKSLDGGTTFFGYRCSTTANFVELGCFQNNLYVAATGAQNESAQAAVSAAAATSDVGGSGVFALADSGAPGAANCKFGNPVSGKGTRVSLTLTVTDRTTRTTLPGLEAEIVASVNRNFSPIRTTISRTTNNKGRATATFKRGKRKLYVRAGTPYCTSGVRVIPKKAQ